jgi:hypothetical protein
MSKNRNLANLISNSNNPIADIVASAPAALDTLNELAAALNNDANFATTINNSLAAKANTSSLAAIATSGSASDLSAGTLPIARISDGAVTATKLASGAAVSNIGYTPTQRHGHGNGTLSTATGTPWLRIAFVQGRFAYRVTVGTTGGWYGPGMTQFIVHRSWGNDLFVSGVVKLNSQYCTQVRANSSTPDQDWFIEVNFTGISSSSGNASNLFDAYTYVLVEPMSANTSVSAVYSGTLMTNPSSAGFISGPVNI